MTFHATFLSVRQLGYKSKATSVNQPSCSYFTFHQQEWKPGQGSVFLRKPGQACRRAGVLLPHVMSMQKMAHWSVQGLPRVLQQLLPHTYNVKLIWQWKVAFKLNCVVFSFGCLYQFLFPYTSGLSLQDSSLSQSCSCCMQCSPAPSEIPPVTQVYVQGKQITTAGS